MVATAIAAWATLDQIRYTSGSDVARPIVIALQTRGSGGDIDSVVFAVSVNGGAASNVAGTRGDPKPTDSEVTDPLPGWSASGGTGPFPVAAAWSIDLAMSGYADGDYIDVTPTVTPVSGTATVLATHRYYCHKASATLARSGVVRWVSPTGSDLANGLTKGTAFLSINKAVNDIRDGSNDCGDGTVYLTEGTHQAFRGAYTPTDLHTDGGGWLHIRPDPAAAAEVILVSDGDRMRCQGTLPFRIWFHSGIVHQAGLSTTTAALWLGGDTGKTVTVVSQMEHRGYASSTYNGHSCRSFDSNSSQPFYCDYTLNVQLVGAWIHDWCAPWAGFTRGCLIEDILMQPFAPDAVNINCDVNNVTRKMDGYISLASAAVNITNPSGTIMRVAETSAGALSSSLELVGAALAGCGTVHLVLAGAGLNVANRGHFAILGGGNVAGVRYVEVTNAAVVAESGVTGSIDIGRASDGTVWNTLIHNDVIKPLGNSGHSLRWCVRATNISNTGRGIGGGHNASQSGLFSVAIDHGGSESAYCQEWIGDGGVNYTHVVMRRCTLRGTQSIAGGGTLTDVEISESVFPSALFSTRTPASLAAEIYANHNHFVDDTNGYGSNRTTGAAWAGAYPDGNLAIDPASDASGAAAFSTGSQWDSGDRGALKHVASGAWELETINSGDGGIFRQQRIRRVMAHLGLI